MNVERIHKTVKLFLWVQILSIVLICGLFWNILRDFGKKVESFELERLSGEGLGILGFLLYYYVLYLIFFTVWLVILNFKKSDISYNSIRNQLVVVFILSILPTIFVLLFLISTSESPFKKYPVVNRLDHKIENGKVIQYSSDSIKIYEADVVNDKIVGKEITRYNSGVISSEKNYKENVLDGESIEYYENGNKKSLAIYVMGEQKRSTSWFENGKKQFLSDSDSLCSYEWWENGQIKLNYYNGKVSNYWEKDGKQTLYSGNGKITIWNYKNGGKLYETFYNSGTEIKETSWYNNGHVNHQRSIINLNPQDAEEIGCKNSGFRGYRDFFYFENGKIKSIEYRGDDINGKGICKIFRYDAHGEKIAE